MIAATMRLESSAAVDVERIESFSAEAGERLAKVTFSEAGAEVALTMPRTVAVELHARLGRYLCALPAPSTVDLIVAGSVLGGQGAGR